MELAPGRVFGGRGWLVRSLFGNLRRLKPPVLFWNFSSLSAKDDVVLGSTSRVETAAYNRTETLLV
jgi:hypothetical protein